MGRAISRELVCYQGCGTFVGTHAIRNNSRITHLLVHDFVVCALILGPILVQLLGELGQGDDQRQCLRGWGVCVRVCVYERMRACVWSDRAVLNTLGVVSGTSPRGVDIAENPIHRVALEDTT